MTDHKQKFFIKLINAKVNGQRIKLISLVQSWIDDEIDKLYNEPELQKLFGSKKRGLLMSMNCSESNQFKA